MSEFSNSLDGTFITIDEVGTENEEDDSVQIIDPDITTIDLDATEVDKEQLDQNNISLNGSAITLISDNEKNDIDKNGLKLPSSTPNKVSLAPNNNNKTKDVDLNTTPVNNNLTEEKRPLIHIQFNDKKLYLMFHEEFLEIINKKLKNRVEDLEIAENIRDKHICISEKVVRKCDRFLIDTTPQKIGNDTPNEVTPSYKKTFQNIVLSGDKNSKLNDRGLRGGSRQQNMCFNCGKNTHTLRDCPEKRDSRKIKKARDEYCRKNDRYHEEFENKFGHIVPGKISDQLRVALDVAKDELPLFIYKMRRMGYPPGWLEEAKIQHSGLTLFDSKGKRVLEEDEDEGEIDCPRHKFDIQKIHDFPGFNVSPGTVHEQSWARNFPRMSFSDSKEELIKRLTESGNIVDGYKRKKLRNLPSVEAEKAEEVNDLTTTSEIEMEIENVDEVKPLGVTVVDIPDSPESPEPCPPGDTLPPIIKELENYCPSPTLEQLENDKKNLLAALGESSVFLDTSEVSTVAVDCSTATIEIVDDSDSCSIVETSIINETIIENCENENTENSQIERQPEIEPIQPLPVPKTIQSTSLGAPVLPSFSGHTVLPSGEKFSKDVCDVIAFENLPDSTGKYEQMRSVISKVREKVKKIQYE